MSESKENKIQKSSISLKGSTISVSDLMDREYNGTVLSEDERKAVYRYERYRILELSKDQSDEGFNQKYRLLQVMANMRPYQEFLDSKFDYLDFTSL